MSIWFDKSANEILTYLQKEYDSTDMIFIGQYYNYQGTFRFVNVKTTDYFSLNFLGNDELNTKLKGKKLWVHIHNELSELRPGVFYQFKAKLSSKAIRERHENPFALQMDETYRPIEYNPDPKEFINRRFSIAENTHFANNQQLAKALNSIQREINKSPETFIFELLQNASDYPDRARENKVYVSFKISDNYLLFCHSGAVFKVNNVHSICSVNESDKSDSIDKIGFKGIGFKSVFKDCNFAYIKSGGYSFRFDSSKFVTEKPYQIIPIWSEPSEMDSEIVETTIFKNSTVSIALKPRRREKLEEYHVILNRLFTDDRILLFLPNIENAKIITPTGFKESKKNLLDYWMGKEQVVIPDNVREWINKEIDDNESVVPEKYYDIQSSIIQFATSRSSDHILKTTNAVLYNYLPTKVNLGFDFLINGDFIPDGTREFFHNIKWNDFLIEQSGFLFLKWVRSIGLKKDERNAGNFKFNRNYLSIIPDFTIIENQIIDERNKHLLLSFKKGFETGLLGTVEVAPIAFIPAQSGQLEPLNNILIDKTGIAVLLPDDFKGLTGLSQKLISSDSGEGLSKVEGLIKAYSTVGKLYLVDDLKADLKKEAFQIWLKNPVNNYKLIKHFYTSTDPSLKLLLTTESIALSAKNTLCLASDLFNEEPEEVSFIGVDKINPALKSLLDNEQIQLNLKPFSAIDFYKTNLKGLIALLNNEKNIINTWNFIYDNWSLFKADDEIKKSLPQLSIVCKQVEEGILNIKAISSVYLPKELAKDDEVETIISNLKLKGKYFILPNFDFAKRPNDKQLWNEIFRTAKAKIGLRDVISELISQLKELEDSLHFKAGIEICKYWQLNREKPDSQITLAQITLIQQSIKLKTSSGFHVAKECIIPEYYTADKRINQILTSIELPNQISSEYQPKQTYVSDWKAFFVLLGCKDLNSEQKIFNEKIDTLTTSQDNLRGIHFAILKDLDQYYQANKKEAVPVTFDFINKLGKLKLQTSSDNTWHLPSDIHLPDEFQPELNIEIDAELQSQFKFLSKGYFENTISVEFLKMLGVHSDYNFKLISPNLYQFYPSQVLTNSKYLPNIWNYIIASDNNIKLFAASNALNIVKSNSTIEVAGVIFKKPTELFSNGLGQYIDDKSLIPLIDFSKFTYNNSTLEVLIGINQELSIGQCLALLRRATPPTQQQVNSLNIVNIMKRYKYSPENLNGLKLPNGSYEWFPIGELYTSTDTEIIGKQPNRLLHAEFVSLSSQLGVRSISANDSEFHFEKDINSTDDLEIKTLFKNRAEYLAFNIKNGTTEYLTLSKQILTLVNNLSFVKCDDISNTISHGGLVWKWELNIKAVSNTIYYIEDIGAKRSAIRKYLYELVSKFGAIKEKVFNRYIFDDSEKSIIEELEKNFDSLPDDWKSSWIKEVEEFIQIELENTEWNEYIPELKNILELSKSHPKEKQKLYNLIAKLKLAKDTSIHFDKAEKDFNHLSNGDEKYFVHSARGSFAYIHPNEILRMRDEGYKMALDFGSKNRIKIYNTAEDILSLNTSHLLAYQYEKTFDELFTFCNANRDANKHLLIIDRENSRDKSKDIFKLLNPEDDYQ
ncbi:sacsin N-terminal ATP-binding-like domain-containing protein [Runella slithyformis]|uniref:ATP-binding protein n=1 Tax=Runella slithyformis (strain ATCC 29530 / DSM 19594 / LMG 11500 / NCIMB 11436 / LSU 4) TaxID=761193 RepID=A0A7U3ZNZ0_RUNSL|nr:hypothetical protein [Runella slithyformis]AEI50618.1 hypothetical protein Runsl_4277 [Runella slithyformis DSM 19594]